MTNGEKFKTAEERGKAFNAYCHSRLCADCELDGFNKCQESSCYFHWLELEAKEEALLPCPFCGGRAEFNKTLVEGRTDGWVQCTYCGVHFITKERDEAIAAWNRRAK